MTDCMDIEQLLWQQLSRAVPRLLTQLDRDPDSPTYGCFDRDYWHYKMRDFSSIVLQQGGLALEALCRYPGQDNIFHNSGQLLSWVDASVRFWASRQLPSGSFAEYYPFEEGYPPTAFSLHAVGLIFMSRGFPEPDPGVRAAIQSAADWILAHQEREALNQEATGLTAVVLAARVPGILVDMDRLARRLDDLFAAQSPEGWFPEYGGADTGYLSVTIDCLWSYYELTGDVRAESAMCRALEFISGLITVSGTTPVMTNSRNTDYIVPYGLIRMAERDPLAARVVEKLFLSVDRPDHFLMATDDRYLCHYIFHSSVRGLQHLGRIKRAPVELPCEMGGEVFHQEAGIHARHVPGYSSVFTACRKGGVVFAYDPSGLRFADYGWRHGYGDGRVALTHWQNPSTVFSCNRGNGAITLTIEGDVTIHCWLQSTVLRHALLRLLSFFFGRRIISRLKKAMIFAAGQSGIRFRREVRIDSNCIVITDIFTGRGVESFRPVPAPAYSLRHVASAANFSAEELLPLSAFPREMTYSDGRVTAEIRLDLGSHRQNRGDSH